MGLAVTLSHSPSSPSVQLQPQHESPWAKVCSLMLETDSIFFKEKSHDKGDS